MENGHEHHFEPITSYSGGFQWIVGYKPCECGVRRDQVMLDRVRNAMAALQRYTAPPWKGYRSDR